MPAPVNAAGLPSNLEDAFEYLDALRESGVTNMFGAGPYLQRELLVSRDVAHSILGAWMSTFSHDSTPQERAAKAREASS